MDTREHTDGRDMIHIMYGSESIETFKALWEQDKDPEKWSQLLHSCYWELSYRISVSYSTLTELASQVFPSWVILTWSYNKFGRCVVAYA